MGRVRVYSRAHILQVSLNLYSALVFGGCMSLSNFSKNSTEAGFTLVEIAIVLVIIGLLLGGILKGQEMITQAKIKNIINDFNGVTVAVTSYQDRYRAIPGDDLNATTRWTTQNPSSGNGDGKVAGLYNAHPGAGAPASAAEPNPLCTPRANA